MAKDKTNGNPTQNTPASNEDAQAQFELDREQFEQQKADFERQKVQFEQQKAAVVASAVPIATVGVGVGGATPEQLQNMLAELQLLKQELTKTIAQAQAGVPPAPPVNNAPEFAHLAGPIVVDLPPMYRSLSADGQMVDSPPPGSRKVTFSVSLPHCCTRKVQMWVLPGQETYARPIAVGAFNKAMGIIETGHQHQVSEIGQPQIDMPIDIAPPPPPPPVISAESQKVFESQQQTAPTLAPVS